MNNVLNEANTSHRSWNNLSMQEKAAMIRVAVKNGLTDLKTIREKYNEFAEGGDIYPSEEMNEFGGGGYIYDVLPGMLKKAGLDIRVSSGYRPAGKVGTSGKRSWHWRHGAVDIVPQGRTTFEDIERVVSTNPEIIQYMTANGFGYLDETNRTPEGRALMKKTGATGNHFHFGKDTRARERYQAILGMGNAATLPVTATSEVIAPTAEQPIVPFFMPSNPQVFFSNPVTTSQPVVDMEPTRTPMLEYDPKEAERQEKRDNLNRFNMFLGMLNGSNESTFPFSMFADGGGIHIKPENRGKFTALKERTGHSATWFKEHGTPAQKKMATFALNSRHWKHGLGGNLFDDGGPKKPLTRDDLRRMLLNRRAEAEAAYNGSVTETQIIPNDNAWVDKPLTRRKKNPHSSRRAEEGAKAHAAWVKDHPVLNTIGAALGAAPFAVAAIPVAGAAVEAAPAVANALAPGSAFWMNPITRQVAASTLGGKAVDLATTTLTPYDSWGEGVAGVINQTTGWNPNDSWWGSMLTDMTNPGYLTPYGLVENSTIKAANAIEDVANNWRPWVPRDANRYYRIVGESGNPIGDAIQSGVVRGPGANPNARASMEATMEAKPIRLATKAHSYPMFSKGKPWEGSTSRIDGNGKPIIIRSKADTGPVKWEESNVDFSHKGHKGIFRPNYYGELNSTPTRYFEYWEPKRFGYMRREFPVDTNPYHNLMGRGYTVDRGNWIESDLGVEGEKFGKYIGSGGEQTVFEDITNPNNVLKAYHDTYTKTPEGLQDLVNDYLRRNSIPLQEPVSFTGYVKQDGYVYPIFNQGKLLPLGPMSSAEFNTKYLPKLQQSLKPYGFIGDGISSEFTNGIHTLVDIKPENMGLTPTGELRFLDMDWVTR